MSIPAQRTSPEGMSAQQTEVLYRMWPRLDAPTQEYIRLYHGRLRHANQQATAAWNKRQDRLSYLTAYCEKNGLTEFNTRAKVADDWDFNDANDDMIRWTREAERCWAAIQAELTMAIMRGV